MRPKTGSIIMVLRELLSPEDLALIIHVSERTLKSSTTVGDRSELQWLHQILSEGTSGDTNEGVKEIIENMRYILSQKPHPSEAAPARSRFSRIQDN